MFNPFENSEMLERLTIPNTYFKNKSIWYQFWFRSLLQKIDSSLIFKGLPEAWPEDVFKFILWARGYLAVFKTERWGIAFQPVTALSGISFYYEPINVSIANQYYNNTLTLHEDVELIKICPDFTGVLDTINFYATQLAEISKSLQMQFISAKTPMCLIANSKAEAELIKSIYDEVQEGNTLVVYKNKLNDQEVIPRKEPFGFWNQDFKQTYIAKDLLENLECVLNNFHREIGLPVAGVSDKRAHTLNAEQDAQNEQSFARLQCWLANLNESFERVEKMFGLHLEVEQHAQIEIEDDGSSSAQDEQRSDRKLGSKK